MPGPIVLVSVTPLDVAPLCGRRLRADDLLDQARRSSRSELRSSKLFLPRETWTFAPRSVRYSCLPAFTSFHGLAHVEGDRPGLRVRHLAARAEDAAELADDAHHVGRRDRDVEVVEALLDLRGEVGGADDVGAGLPASFAFSPSANTATRSPPCRCRSGSIERAAQLLVGVAHVPGRGGSAPRRSRRTSPSRATFRSRTASTGV